MSEVTKGFDEHHTVVGDACRRHRGERRELGDDAEVREKKDEKCLFAS